MSLFIALLGYLCLAVVFLLDKVILSRTQSSVSKPVVYTFYSTVFMFGLLLALPFGVQWIGLDHGFLAIVSGVAFGVGLWTMFLAVEKGEASHINPFIGGVVAIITVVVSSLFLGERLMGFQSLAIAFLIVSTFLFSFESTLKKSGFHVGFLWGILSGVLFAVSHVSAKYLYEIYPFLTALVWSKASIGLVGLVTIAFSSVRKALFGQKKKSTQKTSFRTAILVVFDKALGVVGVLAVQYAIAIGSVSFVTALSGIQYVFMFLLIYGFSRLAPQFFREYFTRRELIAELAAIVCIVVGLGLLVV